MTKKKRSHVDDLRGASALAVEATKGVTALVKQMHQTIASGPAILGKPLEGPVRLVTDIVYGGIRGATSLVGVGIDAALEQLAPLLGASTPGPERAAILAAVNGVLGDYLHETNNALAIEMRFRVGALPAEQLPRPDGAPAVDGEQTADGEQAVEGLQKTDKLLVMVHGSCMNDRQWLRAGHDHGASLAQDLGFRVVYLHYNSGRHISTNGAEFAALLQQLTEVSDTAPEEIVIVAHSMGGLVSRSACHVAEQAELTWRKKLKAVVFLGTPHHGSPLERGGNWVDVLLGVSRYSAPLAGLGKIRSAGVTDLRFGNVLDEHWLGRDRFEPTGDARTPAPLPQGVACYAVAGMLANGTIADLSGDGLVPVSSAHGEHDNPALSLGFPDSHKWIGEGMAHLDLLDRREVYEQVRGWLSATDCVRADDAREDTGDDRGQSD